MPGSFTITGQASAGGGFVTGAICSTTDGEEIGVDSLTYLHKAGTDFGLDHDGTPVATTRVVFVASTTATIRTFKCGLYDTGTTTNVDFDLLKNGTTVLSAVVNVDNLDSDRQILTGTLSDTTLAAGDWLTIDLAVTTSTGATGPFAWVEVEEVAA